MALSTAEYQKRIDFNVSFARQNGFPDGLQDSPNPRTRDFVDWTMSQQRNLGIKIDGYFGSDTFEAYQKKKGIRLEAPELIPEDTSPGIIAYGRSIGAPSGMVIRRWFDPGTPDVPAWLGWNTSRQGVPIRWIAVHEPVTDLKGTWRSFSKVRETSSGKKYSHSVHFTIGLDGQVYQHGPLEQWMVNLPGLNKQGISIEPINRVNGKYRNGRYEAPSPYDGLIMPAEWVADGEEEGYTIPPLAQLQSWVALANYLLPLNIGDIYLEDRILGYDRQRNRFLIGRIEDWREVAKDPDFLPSSITAHKWVGSHSDGVYYLLVLTLYRELGYTVSEAQQEATNLLRGASGQWIDLPRRKGPRQTGESPPNAWNRGSYSASKNGSYHVQEEQAESVTIPKGKERDPFWDTIKIIGAILTLREAILLLRKRRE